MQNKVTLVGTCITEIEERKNINGTKIECEHVTLAIARNSGIKDCCEVFLTRDTKQQRMPFMAGKKVRITGKMQTTKDFKTEHVLTLVHAECIETVSDDEPDINDVKLAGKLGKGITYRTRHSGKRITTIMLETDSVYRAATKCYIPCICWQVTADKVKDWNAGDYVELSGRLQSRAFTKHVDGQADITRTSYEVSIFKIKRLDEHPSK